MNILLNEDVKNLGAMGDVVKVKDGYARNFLIPQGVAVVASKKSINAMQHEQRIIDEKRKKLLSVAEQLAAKVSDAKLSFTMKAGEEGKLFGSITSMDIAEQLSQQGVEVEKKKISIAAPIKSLGEHSVEVSFGLGVNATVTVTVTAEAE